MQVDSNLQRHDRSTITMNEAKTKPQSHPKHKLRHAIWRRPIRFLEIPADMIYSGVRALVRITLSLDHRRAMQVGSLGPAQSEKESGKTKRTVIQAGRHPRFGVADCSLFGFGLPRQPQAPCACCR